MDWRILNYQAADPAWNMAVDEAILTGYLEEKSPPTLRFYGWSPATVSIGYFQDVEREINIDNLRFKGYGLVRRNTGGRAVLHDRELTYSVVSGVKEGLPASLKESYLYISRVLADALQVLGVMVELNHGAGKHAASGACFEAPSWYELTVKGRKLVGSAQYRHKGSFLQHGSILLSFSASDLKSVLNIPSEFSGSFIEKIQDKVCSLEELGIKLEPAELASQIIRSFGKLYGIIFRQGELTNIEMELAHSLVKNKYACNGWNYKPGKTNSQLRFNGIQARNGDLNEILYR